MEQGRDTYKNAEIPIAQNRLDYVLLTHAHIDHSGYLPLLYKNGFRGKIISTDITAKLCAIMLRDSAHIQTQEAAWHNRKGKRADRADVVPIYDINDAEGAIKLFEPHKYGEIVDVIPGVKARFRDIGHLLGSSAIEVWLTEGDTTKKVVFSGDVGNINQPIIRDPATISDTDYLVIESTYGDRLHSTDRPDHTAILAACIQRAFDRGGNVVIPSFAVGRTQEMLYFIREIIARGLVKGHPYIPVYVDSPLANEATTIFNECDPAYFDDETRALLDRGINPLQFPGLNTAVTSEESKLINADLAPKVIISASGMCDAGRIRHHLKHNLWRSESIILFVGYQSVGTLGRIIHDGADEVKIFGEKVAVRAEIMTMPGISGHADKNGLLGWLSAFSPKPQHIFVNHGDDSACLPFTAYLTDELGYSASCPFSGSEYDLLDGKYTYLAVGELIKPKAQEKETRFANNSHYWRAYQSAKALIKLVSTLDGAPNKELARLKQELDALAAKYKR